MRWEPRAPESPASGSRVHSRRKPQLRVSQDAATGGPIRRFQTDIADRGVQDHSPKFFAPGCTAPIHSLESQTPATAESLLECHVRPALAFPERRAAIATANS